tara:strand:+ start:3323 stop:4282 length:960 start_codon:yes stop_codon:yes gene_type:complete
VVFGFFQLGIGNVALIRGIHNIRPEHAGCALTIGNFDGVHLGHRAVLNQLSEFATDLKSVLLTFEPHPREYFATTTAPHRLTPLAEKLRRLQRTGLDHLLVARFGPALANLEPREFVLRILHEKLRVRVLIVGDDFRFGKGGRGDFALLSDMSQKLGFELHRQHSHVLDERRISSTWVRECLSQGDIGKANVLLGDPYCVQGRVAHGRQLGRTIGFPTANIDLTRHPPPISGVFAVLVHGISAAPLPGVANLGRRPTVDGEGITLETNLFDFDGDLYGQRIRVELVQRLREEKKFDSFDALVEQIGRDADAARECLGAT